MKRTILALLLALSLLAALMLPALAQDDPATWVALGDGLCTGSWIPDEEGGFAQYAANESGSDLINLSMDQMTANDLLWALQNQPDYIDAVSTADLILVSVGSVDLLAAFKTLLAQTIQAPEARTLEELETALADYVTQDASGADKVFDNLRMVCEQFSTADSERCLFSVLEQLGQTWNNIALWIRAYNPTAQLVVIGACDPFSSFSDYQSSGIELNLISGYWSRKFNSELANSFRSADESVILAEPGAVSCGAYAALEELFDTEQVDAGLVNDLLSLDVRPDRAGMNAIGETVLKALRNAKLQRPVELNFLDVPERSEYYDAVRLAYNAGLMEGVSDTWFDLDGTLTRAMMVTILYRLDEAPKTNWSGPFWDVSASDWYAGAVQWAYENAVTSGRGDGAFDPDASVTVEELAAFLYRYAQYAGLDTTSTPEAQSLAQTLVELQTLDVWAVDSVAWALSLDVLDLSQARPNESTTRGDTARFLAALLA